MYIKEKKEEHNVGNIYTMYDDKKPYILVSFNEDNKYIEILTNEDNKKNNESLKILLNTFVLYPMKDDKK